MIYYKQHEEIDKAKWDACLSRSENRLIYAFSWYLDIVSPGWDALIEDDYLSIMPLPNAEKYSFAYLYPPPFTQQLGVFSEKEINEGLVKDFLSAIPSKFRYIEMNVNKHNNFSFPDFKERKLITYLLNLNSTSDSLHNSYTTQTKRNLKKALSSSLTILLDTSPKKVINLFSENKGAEFDHAPGYYLILENLMKTILSKKMGQSRGVYDKTNQVCAGAFFIEWGNRTIFLFSGANETAYETQAMTYLINSYIEEKAGQSIIFDFEGSMDKNLARFYHGFGSEKSEYLQIRRNTLPEPIKWLKEFQFRKNISQE